MKVKVMLLILVSTMLILVSSRITEEQSVQTLNYLGDAAIQGCWLKAYGRGVGKPISSCNNGLEKSGLLCYPKCNNGFYGVGPVCWQDCPSEFRNDGAFCFKPSPYGRGVGYALWNKDKCERENKQGCEKNGLLWYPKCKANFHNVACCICSPDCPSGMTDIGISCAKKSYGRGVGSVLECKPEEQYDAGLCYTPCEKGWKSVGPVCWGRCPSGYTECGAICLKDGSCSDQIKAYFNGVMNIVKDFAIENYVGAIIDIAKFAKDFVYDICPM